MLFQQLNPDKCKSYLIINEKTNCCILVDPKFDYADFYINTITENSYILQMVIDTHSHSDHISACSFLKEKLGCIYAMHENCSSPSVDLKLKHKDNINLQGIILTIIYTPGHTDDSICIIVDDKILTGDTLFSSNGCGRNDLPTGSITYHWKSIQNIKKLPQYLIVCPGHNYQETPPSTLWLEKKSNPILKFKNIKDFFCYVEKNYKPIPSSMLKILNENKLQKKDYNIVELSQKECLYEGYFFDKYCCLYITTAELRNKLNLDEVLILLDIRESEELSEIPTISGSINIPLLQLPSRIDELYTYKENTIIVLCRTGLRSKKAAQLITSHGFSSVYVLQGGLSNYYK